MDFFGIGLGEVLLILVVALVIWGPKRLPEIARTLGRTLHSLRKATNDFTTQITRDIDIEESVSSKKEQRKLPQKDSKTGKDTDKNE